ncbi:DNA polymerase III subunit gamma/tau [Parablastomonas sp. CN1-191]|uniref:DNA polymerase III subunit gamma/tau n=1 Tax=Parablastomonas sp. CN1-191 TaxID=3400908 RepID=UPI003BF819C1
MGDSPDIFGNDEPAGAAPQTPTAAELEAAGQSALFGAPPPPPPAPAPEEGATQPAPAREAATQAAPAQAAPAQATPAQSAPAQSAPAQAAPAQAIPAQAAQPYRVLARKYRPQTFAALIGQDAMVQTLGNAIKRDRLAHAFLMTGVRGVGKTSTARLIAKALNCIGPDGTGGPTIDPCGVCEPCVAIAEGRHIDVIEMDAASHTGVDDVREIIEAVRYAAVSARYKIYIIDEVHMLSRNAFNALLKTLEEPPAHVKFLFATTEVEKLPVTVLSRCQRFDLRRIPAPMLAEHFAGICAAEAVDAEDEALAMVATAAEGSVRDGLSILDQAIAHADLDGGGAVRADAVRDMLGLADRSAQRRLLAALLAGDGAGLLALVDQQFALGVEPPAMLRAVLDLVHRVTVAQVGQSGADAISAEERAAIEEWARALSPGQLHRLWQLLLKGHDEVRAAPDPLAAARMALLRTMFAADLPDPGQLARKMEELAASAPAAPRADAAEPVAAPSAALDWSGVIDTVDQSGQLRVAQIMRDWVRVIELAPTHLLYAVAPGYAGDPGAEIRDALLRATGERWEVRRGEGEAAPTLREAADAAKAEERAALLRNPLVEAAFAAFPGAEIVDESAEPQALRDNERNWSRR